jgi:hypothetical protein
MTRSALRRLIDLPGVADLETKALMKPAYADPDRRADHPEVDACAKALFGLTGDEADATPLRDSLDPIEPLSPREQADAFEAAGWDVTDDKRRPLRMLRQFGPALWLAIHGIAGQLPHAPDDDDEAPADWASKLAQDAAKFRRR